MTETQVKERLARHNQSLEMKSYLTRTIQRYRGCHGIMDYDELRQLESEEKRLTQYNLQTDILLNSIKNPIAQKVVIERYMNKRTIEATAGFLGTKPWRIKLLAKEAVGDMIAKAKELDLIEYH